jgi:hypothetical protein
MSIITQISEYTGEIPLIWYPSSIGLKNPIIMLNETNDHIDNVPGLNTKLYPHQRTSLKALVDMENNRVITLKGTIKINSQQSLNPGAKISFNEAVFSDPVGSGKTIVMLALIMTNRTPKAMPDIAPYHNLSNSPYTSYIKIKYPKTKMTGPTLIFVSRAILNQWVAAIKQFTTLKYFSVDHAYRLRDLRDLIAKGQINNFDIILVKNGTVTDSIAGVQSGSIYSQIAELKLCWRRLVLDDYTNIKMKSESMPVRALMTWYMAATREQSSSRPARASIPYDGKFTEYFNKAHISHDEIKMNETLFSLLNVRSNPEFIKTSIAMPHIKYWVYRVINPNKKIMSMISEISGSRAAQIGEMLNGDAIGEAAQLAGIEATSVSAIFSALLDRQYENYKYASAVIEYVGFVTQSMPGLRPLSEWTIDNAVQDDPANAKPVYYKSDLLKFKPVEFQYNNLGILLQNTQQEYIEIKKSIGKAIERVKSNIDGNECCICTETLSSQGSSIIMKCCNAMFCGRCGFVAQRINSSSGMQGICSNCRGKITIKDMIYMNSSLLSDIKDENYDVESEVVPVIKAAVGNKSKFDYIVDICLANLTSMPTGIQRVTMKLPNIMNGTQFLPETPIRKVLIFANFAETLKKVIEKLESAKILYYHMCGTTAEINRMADAFTESCVTCALVINSTQHCAGLNLQTATDLIFTHKITDRNIESQVVGRGHRIGRKSPLNIAYLTFDEEYESLIADHQMRPLSEVELLLESAPVSELLIDQLNGHVDGHVEGHVKGQPAELNQPAEPAVKLTKVQQKAQQKAALKQLSTKHRQPQAEQDESID